MTGSHADCVIADVYLRGLRGYHLETAFDAVMKDFSVDPDTDASCDGGARCGRRSFDELKTYGYVPGSGSSTSSAGESLDFAYDDACIANMAAALIQEAGPGSSLHTKAVDAQPETLNESQTITSNLFDSSNGFTVTDNSGSLGTLYGLFRAKSTSGSWNFLPSQSGLSGLYAWRYGYNEGSAWHFMFYMQYDVPRLASLIASANGLGDSQQALENQLDFFFQSTSNSTPGGYGSKIHEAKELGHVGLGRFASNNQPSWGYEYLYNHTQAPWKTQCIVRNMLDPIRDLTHASYDCLAGPPLGTYDDVYPLFGDGIQGLLGDENTGSMSAWLATSAMGLHPVAGTDRIELGSPLFNEIRVNVPAHAGGPARELVIRAANNDESNIYVDAVELNGTPLDLPGSSHGISHDDVSLSSTQLDFFMRDTPGM